MQFHLPHYEQLTEQMKSLVNFPLEANLLVTGAPGTGKSVVALHRMKMLIQQRKKVILLSYNVLLDKLLTENLGGTYCRTVNSFYGKICYEVNNNEIEGTNTYLTNENINIEEVKNNFHIYLQTHKKYDAIIIDEAQDLSIEVIKAISLLTNHLTLLMDPNQPLSDPCCNVLDVEEYFSTIHKETLERNYRNTKQIYTFAARKFMAGNEFANNPNLTANSPDIITSEPIVYGDKEKITTTEEQIKIIENIISESQGKSIGIFVSNVDLIEEYSKCLKDKNIFHTKYYNRLNSESLKSLKTPLITTYKSSKGLEFDVVIILINEKTKDEEKLNEKLFVLATRAKQKLHFIFAI